MVDGHLSLATLARWLAGDLSHDEVVREIAPHLEARCAVCRERFAELRALQKEVGHWNEMVAVFEGPEAIKQWALLKQLTFEDQRSRIESDESFQNWGLAQQLLRESRAALFENPTQAAQLADLTLQVARFLPEPYDPAWIADLQTRAWAALGNAQRVLGELWS